jgi:glucose 1-dehydrogenase
MGSTTEPFPNLAGRPAVVTGAAQGIGRAIAKRLIDLDAKVVVVDRAGGRLHAEFEHDACHVVVGDIRDGAALADEVIRRVGAVELIVNNVGISTEQNFLDVTEEDYDRVHDTNLKGPYFFTQRLVKQLLRLNPDGPDGSILFLSSVHESIPSLRPHYDMTKAAIGMLVRNLATSLGPAGIRVNAISPGWIRTNPEPNSGEQLEKERHMHGKIPLGRPGTPEDVANLAAFLLSGMAGYLTGETVGLHGALAPGTWMRSPGRAAITQEPEYGGLDAELEIVAERAPVGAWIG